MTNKLVVVINSLKVPKIRKILLYEIKFLVPNYSCLQNPWLGGYRHPDPHSLCPLSSTEFQPPPHRTKFLGTPLLHLTGSHPKNSIVLDFSGDISIPQFFPKFCNLNNPLCKSSSESAMMTWSPAKCVEFLFWSWLIK